MIKKLYFILFFISALYEIPTSALPKIQVEEREVRLQNFFLNRGFDDFDQNLIAKEHRKNLEDIVSLLDQRDTKKITTQRKNLKKAAKLLELFQDIDGIRLDQRIFNVLTNLIKERQRELYIFVLDRIFTIKPIKNGNLIKVGDHIREIDVDTDSPASGFCAARLIDYSGEGFHLYISQEEFQVMRDNINLYQSTKDILSFLGYDLPFNLCRLKKKDLYRGHVGAISLTQISHLKGHTSPVGEHTLIIPQKLIEKSPLSFPIKLNEFDRQCLSEKTQNTLLALTLEKIPDLKRKARREKDPLSQYILGILYTKGVGIKKSFVKATKWLEKSAKNGNPEAQFKLASHYEICLIKRPFYKRVMARQNPAINNFYWYKKAAEQGHAAAQCTLGEMYAGLRSGYNDEFKIDFRKARRWLDKAIQNGFEAAIADCNNITHIEQIYAKNAQEQIERLLKKKKLRKKDFGKIDKIIEEYEQSGCEIKFSQVVLDEIEKRRREEVPI
tara:strand:+ start:88 stop:1584 length:1497 start_codon:yes stop_codon:yes gene_type:complete